MADNPITTPLPADLPTDWVYGQTIGPQGTDVGLSPQHGYNYLMQQVNAAQQAATQIGQAFIGLPSLGSGGKIPPEQLPEMDFDEAGSAAAVQKNLDAHTGNKNNPHGVTAAQVGADPAGSAAAVQASLSAHTGNRNNPHGVTAQQAGADPAGSAAAVQQALASQIAELTAQMGGKGAIQTGSYVGTGNRILDLTLPVTPKVLILTGYFIAALVIVGVGDYWVIAGNVEGDTAEVTNFGTTVSLQGTDNNYNLSNRTYYWIALY